MLSQKAKGWEETKEAVIIIITHSKVEILHFHSNEKDFENQTEKDFAALDLECEKHLCRNKKLERLPLQHDRLGFHEKQNDLSWLYAIYSDFADTSNKQKRN